MRDLSRREFETLDLLANGHSVKSAAAKLGVSYHTADRFKKIALAKLGAVTVAHAVAIASNWPEVKPSK